MTNEIVINGEGAVLGRLATYVAKQSLMGNKVAIVNVEKIIVTGSKPVLEKVFLTKRQIGGTSQKGPYYSKNPEKMVKRAIRGMLPWKKTAGREAFKRIRCYVGVPSEYESKEKKEMKREVKSRHLTIKQISKLI